LYSELFFSPDGVGSAASLLYFLELKERLKEALFRALENLVVIKTLKCTAEALKAKFNLKKMTPHNIRLIKL
jgi:hypothetical protein